MLKTTMVGMVLLAFSLPTSLAFRSGDNNNNNKMMKTTRSIAPTGFTSAASSKIPGSSTTALQMSFWDKFIPFDGSKNEDENKDIPVYDGELVYDNNEAVDVKRLAVIPAKSIRVGGLRLLLFFFCLGQSNKPQPKAWKCSQPNETTVNVLFHDLTGAIAVRLSEEEGVVIERLGYNPSVAYTMQETVLLQGILDELQKCVDQPGVAEDDRLLLLFPPGNAVENAKQSLSFA